MILVVGSVTFNFNLYVCVLPRTCNVVQGFGFLGLETYSIVPFGWLLSFVIF